MGQAVSAGSEGPNENILVTATASDFNLGSDETPETRTSPRKLDELISFLVTATASV